MEFLETVSTKNQMGLSTITFLHNQGTRSPYKRKMRHPPPPSVRVELRSFRNNEARESEQTHNPADDLLRQQTEKHMLELRKTKFEIHLNAA
jgi:hypothetical protein